MSRPRAGWLLAIVASALAFALTLYGPIPQWENYHAFADARSWLGLPNAENVLSNLPFAIIGIWGLIVHARSGRAVWRLFSAAVLCTALGSAAYHWAPGNALLVFDRLPIAWACATLTCAVLAERLDARWSALPVLAAGVAVATMAVAWWWLTERQGHGDLRPYLFVQFMPMLIVPAALRLKLPVTDPAALPNKTWWIVLGLYAAAKLMELADHSVFDALAFVSGHTLKHLFAAGAAWYLLHIARSAPSLISFDSRR
jgi:hypothetical protein